MRKYRRLEGLIMACYFTERRITVAMRLKPIATVMRIKPIGFYFFNFNIEKSLSDFLMMLPSIPRPVISISTRSLGCSHCG